MTLNMVKKWLKSIGHFLLVIVLALVLALGIRVFVFDFYAIPSDSMQPTLEPGDFILVNKLSYGARLYKNFDFLHTGDEPETWRMPGFTRVFRNDVVVFNYLQNGKKRDIEMNLSCFYVKRCIGLPGDTLAIINGFYTVNGQTGYGNLQEQKKLSEEKTPREGCEYRTRAVAPGKKWNIRNWGPVCIPARGMKIVIDTNNIQVYRRMIAYENRERKFNVQGNEVRLDDCPLKEYTFLHNWYFMGGDHLYNSRDSRYIGLVPEKFIVGKVALVLTGRDRNSGTYNWERFMKKVNGGSD